MHVCLPRQHGPDGGCVGFPHSLILKCHQLPARCHRLYSGHPPAGWVGWLPLVAPHRLCAGHPPAGRVGWLLLVALPLLRLHLVVEPRLVHLALALVALAGAGVVAGTRWDFGLIVGMLGGSAAACWPGKLVGWGGAL